MMAKEVKKRSKKIDFYLTVFNLIKSGERLPGICKILNISKQNLKYYTDKLKAGGHIVRIGYGVWEVKKEVKTFSLGSRVDKPITNLHALQINIPILRGKIKDTDWQTKEKLNNWIPKYKGVDNLGGLTIKNNNNKSITIFAKSRNISNLNEVDNLAFKIKAYIVEYMRLRGVALDVFNAQTKNLNLATEDKDSESMLRKGERFELDLNKTAENIFPKDNMEAKAWLDGSPFKFSVESNDKEWKRYYLGMPFSIKEMLGIQRLMADSIRYVAENYESHTGLVEEGHKVFKKLNKILSQKRLGPWL